jgi:hypothetical protein
MAVVRGTRSNTIFMGLSSDTKPVGDIELSAQFYEYDTGKTYIWTGGIVPPAAGWVEYLPLYPQPFDSASVLR